jgi:hypothetical protein
MVRDEAKLPSSPNLRVTRGSVDKSPDLAKAMVGHDVVINAAGNVAGASGGRFSHRRVEVALPPGLRKHKHVALANAGHDTRAIQDWLGHRSIQHTVRYTELAPARFKDFWR